MEQSWCFETIEPSLFGSWIAFYRFHVFLSNRNEIRLDCVVMTRFCEFPKNQFEILGFLKVHTPSLTKISFFYKKNWKCLHAGLVFFREDFSMTIGSRINSWKSGVKIQEFSAKKIFFGDPTNLDREIGMFESRDSPNSQVQSDRFLTPESTRKWSPRWFLKGMTSVTPTFDSSRCPDNLGWPIAAHQDPQKISLVSLVPGKESDAKQSLSWSWNRNHAV